MPHILLSYDIESDGDMHEKFKEEMLKKGYLDTYNRKNLPYTTLIKEETTPQQAQIDFRDIKITLSAKVRRAIVIEFKDSGSVININH